MKQPITQFPLFEADKQREIKKHSSLVQAGNISTALERKVINALIWIAKDMLKRSPEQRIFTCEIGLIRHLSGVKKQNNNEDLKDVLKNLRRKEIEYNIFGKDENKR